MPLIDDVVAHYRDPDTRYAAALAVLAEVARRFRRIALEETAVKACLGCGRDLPLSAYHRNATRPDGHHAECRSCRSTVGIRDTSTPT